MRKKTDEWWNKSYDMNKWLKTNNDDNNKRKSNEIVAKLLLENQCSKLYQNKNNK